jgi:hypothetical protein
MKNKEEKPIIQEPTQDISLYGEQPVIETVTEKAIVEDVKPEARREFWQVTSWKGVKNVLKCKNCGHCEDDKDQMILHVITHFPKSEQEEMFNKLVKEY